MEVKLQLTHQIRADICDPRKAEFCIRIFEYLFHRYDEIEHLTLGNLKNASRVELTDREVLEAVEYLTGDSMHLLDMHFEFVDDERTFQVSEELLREAEVQGGIAHPVTGEFIENFKSRIFIYFVPGALIAEISGAANE